MPLLSDIARYIYNDSVSHNYKINVRTSAFTVSYIIKYLRLTATSNASSHQHIEDTSVIILDKMSSELGKHFYHRTRFIMTVIARYPRLQHYQIFSESHKTQVFGKYRFPDGNRRGGIGKYVY